MVEIIELCRGSGLPKTQLGREANVGIDKLSDILLELMTGDLISVETRSRSFSGDKRETDFYLRTRDGDTLIERFSEVRERLSTPGAPRR
jgi:predicted transcriptional regulator